MSECISTTTTSVVVDDGDVAAAVAVIVACCVFITSYRLRQEAGILFPYNSPGRAECERAADTRQVTLRSTRGKYTHAPGICVIASW